MNGCEKNVSHRKALSSFSVDRGESGKFFVSFAVFSDWTFDLNSFTGILIRNSPLSGYLFFHSAIFQLILRYFFEFKSDLRHLNKIF